jgi:hypothetical protein
MKHVVLALALSFSANVFAANKPANFDAVKWDKLVNKIFEKGEVTNIPAGELRYLKQIVPEDASKSHRANYLSLLGRYTNLAQYIPTDVSAVEEDWQTENGVDWVIDQWTFHVTPDGDLISVSHQRLVEHDGQVLDYKEIPVGAADQPEQMQRWADKLNEWYGQAGI